MGIVKLSITDICLCSELDGKQISVVKWGIDVKFVED